MAEEARNFSYVALDGRGRRVRGSIEGVSEAAAYERLRRDGLSPLGLRATRAKSKQIGRGGLSDRDTAEMLSSLGDLLKAGADMRTSLEILGARAARPSVAKLCAALVAEISGGEALEHAFARHMGGNQEFVGAMVAAGEAGGDLPGALLRASEMIEARVKLQSRLVSILAYPAFVLVSSVAAILALLLFVVPTLAPLIQDTGGPPPVALGVFIWLSDVLRAQMNVIVLAAVGLVLAALAAARAGLLAKLIDRALLDGPTRPIVSALSFGSFAIALGGMLSAGAPMSETLRLAVRAVRSPLARERLEPVLVNVRQGQSLSSSLEEVRGFPGSIARLSSVGEATGALGAMLTRGGRLEEEAATRKIEAIGNLLGPALIVVLGGLVGAMMAGLLSGVSQLGQSALQ
ncbi:type II secretion system F family protein [Phenylobacterium sp.]|uniref:type II secretion system F family protein n=1 Tax=Phenylobacterium sp. TaxID=1871053 RepID=UPI0028A2A3BB|nr:type II secretion system F family protein [Phenylobacterium sp.]